MTKLNGKGLYTPILSADRTTWKSLKSSADLKASCLIGDPILLLSGVTTFKKLLLFAYAQGILDSAQGQEFIDAKNESLREVAKAPRASQTIEEAMKDPTIGKRFGSSAEMVKDSLRQSVNFAAEFNVQGAGHLKLSSAAQQLVSLAKPGSVNVPSAMAAAAQFPGAGAGPSGGHQTQPIICSGYEGDVVRDFDLTGFGPTVPQSSGGGGAVATGAVAGETQQVFDITKVDLDGIDNEIAQLDTDPNLEKKYGRMRSLSLTLRKSLAFACLSNQRLIQSLDASDMRNREHNSSSAAEVIAEVNPPVLSMSSKVDSLLVTVDSLRKEVGDLADMVQTTDTVTKDGFTNIERHLSTFGMVDVGSSFDLPAAVTSIYRVLHEDILPTFQSGNVMSVDAAGNSFKSGCVVSSDNAGNLLLPAGGPAPGSLSSAALGHQLSQQCFSSGTMAHSEALAVSATVANPTSATVSAGMKRHQDGSVKEVASQLSGPTFYSQHSSSLVQQQQQHLQQQLPQQQHLQQQLQQQNQQHMQLQQHQQQPLQQQTSMPLLSLPPQFHHQMRNYLPVNGPNSGLQSMAQFDTPQKPGSQFGDLSVPPPPVKQQWQQYGGYHVYGPPVQQYATHVQGLNLSVPQFPPVSQAQHPVQTRKLFSCPPPSVPAVDQLSGRGVPTDDRVVSSDGTLGKSVADSGSAASGGVGGDSGSVVDTQ